MTCNRLLRNCLSAAVVGTLAITALFYCNRYSKYHAPFFQVAEPTDALHANHRKDISVRNLTSPVNDTLFECVSHNSTFPPVTICLHATDVVGSLCIKQQQNLEPNNIAAIEDALRRTDGGASSNKRTCFVDVGANLGYFTLKMAKQSFDVIAVEPLCKNAMRLHRAAQLNDVIDRIVLVTNPLSNVRRNVFLINNQFNPGDVRTRLTMPSSAAALPRGGLPADNSKPSDDASTCPLNTELARSILLDDLLPILVKGRSCGRIVIRIDVQQHEHRVLLGAEKLLAQMEVALIVSEWVLVRQLFGRGDEEEALVAHALALMRSLGYTPYQPHENGLPLNWNEWNTWPYDVYWRKS